MSIIDTLITDRTAGDVERVVYLTGLWVPNAQGVPQWTGTAAELSEWTAGAKGAYNATDLNRVGEALLYLAGLLNARGYTVTVSPKTDWTVADNPTATAMAHYLAQVSAIRDVIPLLPTTPAVPADLEGMTYMDANDIERILTDLDTLLANMAQAWFYCGEVYCGEV